MPDSILHIPAVFANAIYFLYSIFVVHNLLNRRNDNGCFAKNFSIQKFRHLIIKKNDIPTFTYYLPAFIHNIPAINTHRFSREYELNRMLLKYFSVSTEYDPVIPSALVNGTGDS